MSYTELVPFKEGKAQPGPEFRNAWGGAARIWDALFEAHVPKKHQYDSWVCNSQDRRLWDLALRKDLEPFERSVHAFTFDRFFIRQEHFKVFADHLRSFVQKYPGGDRVDHLLAWADWIESNLGLEAIGLYATSVGENLWFRPKKCACCENDSDEIEPVPLSEGHEVFDWLESVNK